jgi:quercetin dioxygenase-like cupin family protein
MEKPIKLPSLTILIALLVAPLQAQAGEAVTVTPVLSSTVTSSGQPVVLPQKDAQIVISIYDVMPGAKLAAHNHPHPRYAYVLSGVLRVHNIDTGQTDTYEAGAFVLESMGQWHADMSIGREPLKLLVIDVVEKGQPNVVPLP